MKVRGHIQTHAHIISTCVLDRARTYLLTCHGKTIILSVIVFPEHKMILNVLCTEKPRNQFNGIILNYILASFPMEINLWKSLAR